jgi:hypothetical protein
MESRPGRYLAGHYLAALAASALGLCGGGWLVLTPFAFGYPGRGREAVTALATGGGLIVVSLLSLSCWAVAWRHRLRADGVLPHRESRSAQRKKAERRAEQKAERSARRQARAERLVRVSRQREIEAAPDPAQVLTDLRALLTPLLSAAEDSVAIVPEPVPEPVAEANREVQAPGHLRGTRSASFFAVPEQAGPQQEIERDLTGTGALMRGAELLMVGTGEEESW